MTTPRFTTRDSKGIATAIAGPNRRAFTTHGALSGGPDHGGPFGAGRLPDDWARTFTARRKMIDYVIRSYATPIAWHDRETGWTVPTARYSVTTSKHQSTAGMAIYWSGEPRTPGA